MKKDLAGNVVLITGASSGIGWCAAQAFAQRGCRLALAARNRSKLAELARLISPAESIEIVCDVREMTHAKAAVDAAVKRWGRIDFLINNAGILENISFETQEMESIHNIINTNFMGCVHMLKAVLPVMRTQGSGHIVNVASTAGHLGVPYMAVYCASKFALVGLTESLRREYYGSGITMTSFCPGLVDTPMAVQATESPDVKRLRAKAPEAVAKKIVRACEQRAKEVYYSEVPGTALKLSRFFPALTDWATHKAVTAMRKKSHPASQ